MTYPTLTEIEDADWEFLTTNATAWTCLADTWEASFTEVREASKTPGGTPWTGAGAEAFQHRTAADVVTVHGPADMLRRAADIAARAAQAQQGNKAAVLEAIGLAERDEYRVGDDYSVTDTWAYYTSAAEQEAREFAAERHRAFIRSRADNLVHHEQEIARQLGTATAGLHTFSFGEDGADGGAGGNGRPHVPAPVAPDTMIPLPTPRPAGWRRNVSMICGIRSSSARYQPIQFSAATRAPAPKPDGSFRLSWNLVRLIQTDHR